MNENLHSIKAMNFFRPGTLDIWMGIQSNVNLFK